MKAKNSSTKKKLTKNAKKALLEETAEQITIKRSKEAQKQAQKTLKKEIKKLKSILVNANAGPPPKIRLQQVSFYVSINMNQFGEHRIRQILFSKGRPPTNYKGKGGQGSHIVAYSLLVAAFKGQLAGTKPDETGGAKLVPGEDDQNDAINRLENLFNALKEQGLSSEDASLSTGNSFEDEFSALRQLRNEIPMDGENENLRQKVRQKLSELRQRLQIVIEEITKKWNKRDDSVYELKKDVQIFGSGLDNRENSARDFIEDFDFIIEGLSAFEIDDTREDKAHHFLSRYEGADKAVINKALSRLIDIRPQEEFTKVFITEQDSELAGDFVSIKKKYNGIFKKAIKEAEVLGKLAYPSIANQISSELIKDNIKDAVLDDLETRIVILEAKTTRTIKEAQRLEAYKSRKETLEKL